MSQTATFKSCILIVIDLFLGKMNGVRRLAPSIVEMDFIRDLQPVFIRFNFMDNKVKALGIHPTATGTVNLSA